MCSCVDSCIFQIHCKAISSKMMSIMTETKNKSNSTAGAIQVQANLYEQLNYWLKFYLTTVSQGQEYDFRNQSIRWRTINLSNPYFDIFCARSLSFRDINNRYIWLWKGRSRSPSTIFVTMPFDGKCQNLQKSYVAFLASSHRSSDISI